MPESLINFPEINSYVVIYRNIVPPQECEILFKILERDCTIRYPITVYGRETIQPRTNCVYSDDGINEMKYSTATIKTIPWNNTVKSLRDSVSHDEFHPDSALINGYLNREDKVGFHRDKFLKDSNNTVCTVSIGGTRRFRFRPYKNISCPVQLPDKIETYLNNGDIVYMHGNTNIYFEHEIPSMRINERFEFYPRYSVTFRQIK